MTEEINFEQSASIAADKAGAILEILSGSSMLEIMMAIDGAVMNITEQLEIDRVEFYEEIINVIKRSRELRTEEEE